MNTITVQDTQYEFQDIPGKGKCLVPVKDIATEEFITLINENHYNAKLFNKFKFDDDCDNLKVAKDPFNGNYFFTMDPLTSIEIRAVYGAHKFEECFFTKHTVRKFLADKHIKVSYAK